MRSAGAGQHKGQSLKQKEQVQFQNLFSARPRSPIAAFVLPVKRSILFKHLQLYIHSVRVTGVELPTAERECDIDGGFYFYWLIVEEVGAVAPCFDGVNRGLTEHERATYYAEILDAAGGGDSRGKNNRAGGARGARDDGIDRVGFGEDHSLGDSGRYGHRMSRRGFHYDRCDSREDCSRRPCAAWHSVADTRKIGDVSNRRSSWIDRLGSWSEPGKIQRIGDGLY